ncbi:ATP-dependent RNA helicase RhlE [Mucilaginibacter yixingensis]|uniref:ATP-dependent RNA helicase RhlE n=1 Tax=Mucilaginibacter yixingensis TaxID=1295612 RepID=A0A2T5J6S6_9SPHI|nr:DEAD/DEAH box helicase [Mucilaginibacter yixingensis]PTQ94161.1 ATP-dependent RNA helicase RhlE [Mucilaginibacter yixingensis]
MAWLDKFKLKKGLVQSLNEAGFVAPKEIQQKTLTRINGGQDVIVVGPEGCGKTTTYILATLNKFNYTPDGVPKVLILAPDKEKVEEIIVKIDQLNKNKTLSIVPLFATPGIEAQMDAMAEGADIVVATPDRARAIYLKLGLDLNKIELLVIDDAELIVKQGLQLPVTELVNSMPKCQHLVFTEVLHERLNRMIQPFMKQPATVEVEEIGEPLFDTHPQILYLLPNFGTKVNLLNLFMQDEDLFTKVVLFVNTRPTAEKLYKDLQHQRCTVALLNPWFFEMDGFTSLQEFKDAATRVLIVVNDGEEKLDLNGIPFLIHFELPVEKETYIDRMIITSPDVENEIMAITFASDLELTAVKKIEQATGQKIPLGELPEDLIVEKERTSAGLGEKKAAKAKANDDAPGAAFHEKKASNSKTYNYGGGVKAKMNNKKNH